MIYSTVQESVTAGGFSQCKSHGHDLYRLLKGRRGSKIY